MIRDRGRIKWTAMMLPEHVKMLRDWAKENNWESQKELDEQRLEELDEVIQAALKLKREIVVHYYLDKNYETVKGTIRALDTIEKELKLIDSSGSILSIPLNRIEDIQLLDEPVEF